MAPPAAGPILGSCNPPLACQALGANADPDSDAMRKLSGVAELEKVAADAKARLERTLASVEATAA